MGSERMHWFSTSLYDDPQAAHQLDHVSDDARNSDTAGSRFMHDTPTRAPSAHDPATAERSTVHRGPLPERDSATDARARVEATARRPARRSRARRLGAALPLALFAGDLVALVIASAVLGGEWDAVVVFAVLTLVTRAAARQYRPRLSLSMLDDIPRVLGSLVAAVGLSALVMVALGSEHISTVVLLQRAAVFLAASLVLQAVVVSVSRRRRLGHEAGRRTLVVGGGRVGATIVDALIEHPELGLRPVAVAEPGARPRLVRHDEVPVLANDMRQLADTVVDSRIDATILAMGDGDAHVDTVIALHQTGCEIFLVPSMFEMHHDGPDVERVRGVPMIRLRPDPTQRLSWWIKRSTDIAVAGLGLLVLAVPLAIVALLVMIDSGRPIMFWQERVGLDGRRFRLCKFRSMRPRSETESQTQWNIAEDPRVSRVGRLLRRSSVDEIPQLWNILRGQMSLVGPRPERPTFVEKFTEEHERYWARHRVPVGLTGLAQVNGLRGDTSIQERARYDNYYIANWSLWLDVKIVLLTAREVFGGRGR